MVWVVVCAIMLMSAMYAAYQAAENARETIERELQYSGQAMNMARAGITEALSWFRRQTTQPVTVFAPRLDPLVDPPVNETEDPAIGIVRSLEISSMARVWARYEVRIDRVADITEQRGLSGFGGVWQIDSEGILYRNMDPAMPYNEEPNRVLARVRLATEIRRLMIVLPAPSATCIATPVGSNFGTRSKVIGGSGMGCVYPPVGAPTITGTISGTPAQSTVNPYKGTIQDVFGVTDAELRALADQYTTDPSALTSPLPQDKLIYMDGDITFDAARPLEGTAVLVVNGDVTVMASTNAVFNGLLYVNGNCTINAPALVRGVVITNGTLTLTGTGDYVEIDYDSAILDQLLRTLGQYRYSCPVSLVE